MKTIAVVEDNSDNRMLIDALLGDEYHLIEYEDGIEALSGLLQEKPDLVLLDISLPGMDGTEVLKNIRSDSNLNDLPVIALTAHAMSGDREKFLQLGFNEYISKPIIDENELIKIIEIFI